MDIIEQANKYAEGKLNQAISKTIADAYVEGYKAGYNAREEAIPLNLRNNKTEYVDLGLPSGTLWSMEYEKQTDGSLLYLPYGKTSEMNLPTKEQIDELIYTCQWKGYTDYNKNFKYAICVGPNGNSLTFQKTGYQFETKIMEFSNTYFWIKDENETNEKNSLNLYFSVPNFIKIVRKSYSGFKLPIRLVK